MVDVYMLCHQSGVQMTSSQSCHAALSTKPFTACDICMMQHVFWVVIHRRQLSLLAAGHFAGMSIEVTPDATVELDDADFQGVCVFSA